MELIIFDVETTGLSPERGDRIIEIGAIKIVGEKIVDEYNSLISSTAPISSHAQSVHGINPLMLRGHPEPHVVFPDFRKFIGTASLVAHNVQFDSRFLRAEFGRLGYGLPNRLECTLRLSRQSLAKLPNYKLETVYRHLGGVVTIEMQRHRALDDARMAAFVWLALTKKKET